MLPLQAWAGAYRGSRPPTACLFCCRLIDESVHDMASSLSSSLTLVTTIDEDTDVTPVNTPHAAKPTQLSVTDSAPTDPVTLLPTTVSEMFPASVPAILSTGSFVDASEDGIVSADDDFHQAMRVPQNSESSGGTSEGAAELSEILDNAAEQSDDLNADQP